MPGLLTTLFSGIRYGATYQPWDDFWYQREPRGGTNSGVYVSPEAAMRLSAVYACVDLLSDMVGMLPLIMYRRLDNDGKERATSQPLYRLLRRRPNPQMTAKTWRKLGMVHLLYRGKFYNRIEFDGRGAVSALWPMHPDCVQVVPLSDNRRGYVYREPGKPERRLLEDEVLFIPGLTTDGVNCCGVLEYARESLGRAWAEEAHAARFWKNDAKVTGTIEVPAGMTKTQRAELLAELQSAQTGDNAFKTLVLHGGMKWARVGATSRDAQFIESREFSVADIARWFRVPPHMIGDVDRATSWGSGIEQQTIGFVNFTLMPWLVDFEQEIDRVLIDDETYFAEFLVDALLRGDMQSRATAYAQYVMNGIMSENEVRKKENLNPYPGLDVPRRSVNQDRGGDPSTTRPTNATTRPTSRPAPTDDDEEQDDAGAVASARMRQVITAAAERLVRKETVAIRRWAARYAADPPQWRKWVTEFYGEYAGELEAALALKTDVARAYCAGHCETLLRMGVRIVDEWETHQAAALADIALQEVTA